MYSSIHKTCNHDTQRLFLFWTARYQAVEVSVFTENFRSKNDFKEKMKPYINLTKLYFKINGVVYSRPRQLDIKQ